MSTKILVADARARFNHHESKLYLKEKYSNLLCIPFNGGMWNISIELITFLRTPSLSNNDTEILVDIYGTPIKIQREKFLEVATETYNRVMEQWLLEFTELSNNR